MSQTGPSPIPIRAPTATRGRAFGLDVDASLALPGIPPREVAGPPLRPVTVGLSSEPDLEASWRPEAPERIFEIRLPDGSVWSSIDADSQAGFLFRPSGYGIYWISADGRRIVCAPPESMAAWRWQRYMIGQLLPFSALLHGLEVFHASAVVVDGRALAVAGVSEAGKTSLAGHLVLRGARFLTDDVVVLETSGDDLLAHPGAALMNLRPSATELQAELARGRLGRALGSDEEGTRVEVERHHEPAPLGALCLIERGADDLDVSRPSPLDPRWLLAASFNFALRGAERLTNQLDVCARIAASAVVLQARVPDGFGPEKLAELLEEEARSAWLAIRAETK
jgi:hypothetical protein